jgi:hypothetical protein
VGQVLNVNTAALAENESILDGIAQFADITRPGYSVRASKASGVSPEDLLAAADRIAADKTLGDQRDIFPTIGQRGAV